MPCTPKVSLIGRLIRFPGSMKFQNEEGKALRASGRAVGSMSVIQGLWYMYIWDDMGGAIIVTARRPNGFYYELPI